MARAAGGYLDALCDIAVQVALVAAVIEVSGTSGLGFPIGLRAFRRQLDGQNGHVGMAKEGTNDGLITSRSAVVQAVKIVRDYGFIVTVIAACIAVRPAAVVWVMVLFTVVNTVFWWRVSCRRP